MARKFRDWFRLKGIEKTIAGYAINWADLKDARKQPAMQEGDRVCYEFIECVCDGKPKEITRQKRKYDLLKHIIYARRYSD